MAGGLLHAPVQLAVGLVEHRAGIQQWQQGARQIRIGFDERTDPFVERPLIDTGGKAQTKDPEQAAHFVGQINALLLNGLPAAEQCTVATRVQALFEQGSTDFDFARLKLQADQIVDPSLDIEAELAKTDAMVAVLERAIMMTRMIAPRWRPSAISSTALVSGTRTAPPARTIPALSAKTRGIACYPTTLMTVAATE